MRPFVITSIVASLAAVTASASADEPQSKSFYASSISYAFSSEGKGLPSTTMHSFIEFIPIGGEWNFVLKGSMTTPLSTFQPAPQLNLGASLKASSSFAFGATALYRYIPSWTAPNAAHLVGISLAPAILLPSKIALVFPLSAARNLSAKATSFAVAFEVAFQL